MNYIVLLLALAVPAANAEKPKSDTKKETKVPFMFVQTAESGALEANKDGSGYKLTLKGVSPQTIYFSDRPERIAGGMTQDKFLKGLGFSADNPPNAAVVLSEPKSKHEDVMIVTLANPVYNAEARTLVYEAKPLNNVEGKGLAFWAGEKDKSLPSTFSNVSVFIDDCPDSMVYCYGNYEFGGRKKCRTNCGPLGKKVGFCFSPWELNCKPCRDYTDECRAPGAPCVNSPDPGCTRRACSTSQDCM